MNSNATTNATIPEVKIKRKYIRKVKPVLVVESDDEILSLDETSIVLENKKITAKSEVEDEPDIYTDGGEEDDDKSSISTITDENEEKEEEEVEEEEAVVEAIVAEVEVVEDPLPAKMLLPTLESDPVVLRTLVTTLQAEVVRLTAFSQDLQRRVDGVRKQPKTKAAKAEKVVKEGKRKNTRPKRPDDYAQRFLQMGQVLKWTHLSRNAWAEATYIGAGKFRARYSFKDEIDEGLTLNAVSAVMSLHITIRGVNAWSAFKNLDGTSVENLDLVAA